jgi:hypothetical protein
VHHDGKVVRPPVRTGSPAAKLPPPEALGAKTGSAPRTAPSALGSRSTPTPSETRELRPADTNATSNTDETWVSLRDGFGEVRLGDEDGAADADGIVKGPADAIGGIGTDGIKGTSEKPAAPSPASATPAGATIETGAPSG